MSIEKPEYFQPEMQLTSIIKDVAEIHKIHLSDETLSRFTVIASSCGIADDELDRCLDPEKRELITQNAFSYLTGETDELTDFGCSTHKAYEESMDLLRGVYNSMAPGRQEDLMRKLRIWHKLSEEQRTCSNRDESIKLRKVDLNVTAGIYLIALPVEDRKNPEFQAMMKNFKRMVRIAGMLDDCMDLPDDYQNCISPIQPTPANRLELVKRALLEGTGMFSWVFKPEVLKGSFSIMRREFRRRVTRRNNDQYKLDIPSESIIYG